MENGRAQADLAPADATAAPGMNGANHPRLAHAFLEALRECGSATRAAADVGLPLRTAYRWRSRSPAFRYRWRQAKQTHRKRKLAQVEAEIHRRAVDGWDETTVETYGRDDDGNPFTKTKVVRRYSDGLLLREAARLAPHIWGKRSTVEVKDGRDSPAAGAVARRLLADPVSREALLILAERASALEAAEKSGDGLQERRESPAIEVSAPAEGG